MQESEFKLSPNLRLGPVSLRVMDLGLILSFYEHDLGLTVLRREGNVVELGASKAGKPILILRHVPDAEKPPPEAAGLYHYALLVPDRKSLAAAYISLGNAGIVFDGFADHLVSEALYLTDPEGNGIEIYSDRPRDHWKFDEDGQVNMATQPLDLDSLLKEVSSASRNNLKAFADETRVGHVHLKVTDLQRSMTFYRSFVGLDLMRYYESAAFLSAGGYHHHLGINTWESLAGKPVKRNWAGLESVTFTVPEENFKGLTSRLSDNPYVFNQGSAQFFVSDPDEIELAFKGS